MFADGRGNLQAQHPEVASLGYKLKFPGPGQRETHVADARGIVRIAMLLPCRAAELVRANGLTSERGVTIKP